MPSQLVASVDDGEFSSLFFELTLGDVLAQEWELEVEVLEEWRREARVVLLALCPS